MLLLADDMALLSSSPKGMQAQRDLLHPLCGGVGSHSPTEDNSGGGLQGRGRLGAGGSGSMAGRHKLEEAISDTNQGTSLTAMAAGLVHHDTAGERRVRSGT